MKKLRVVVVITTLATGVQRHAASAAACRDAQHSTRCRGQQLADSTSASATTAAVRTQAAATCDVTQ